MRAASRDASPMMTAGTNDVERRGAFLSAWSVGDGPVEVSGAGRAAWWSLTKTMVAAACFRLVDEGRIDLDRRLSGRPYSMRQLLRHVGGVPNYTSLPEYAADVRAGGAPWPDEAMLTKVGAAKLQFPPGSKWAYSNTGYAIARRELERVCDRSFAELTADLVIGPLGLTTVEIAETPADLDDCRWLAGTGYHPGWVYHGLATGEAADAVRFLSGLFASDYLSHAARAELVRPTDLGGPVDGRPWRTAAYGAGVMVGAMADVGGALGHSGCGDVSVSAAYRLAEMTPPATICVFAGGNDESPAEWEARRIALSLAAPRNGDSGAPVLR
ncbi:MAG: serine hydrolase domain-containing protein [Pseudomonadota bacterium]